MDSAAANAAAQAYVDALPASTTYLCIPERVNMTVIPLRIPGGVTHVDFRRCTSLTSVEGLPEGVRTAYFAGCTSLTSVAGLPAGVKEVYFTGCTSLTRVAGLPASVIDAYFSWCTSLISIEGMPEGVKYAYFSGCTSLTSVEGLPAGTTNAYFTGCTSLTSVVGLPAGLRHASFFGCPRLRRWLHPSGKHYVYTDDDDDAVDPASEVRDLMVSGVSDLLLCRLGRDTAQLVAQFATAGMGRRDRLLTMPQVRQEYGFSNG